MSEQRQTVIADIATVQETEAGRKHFGYECEAIDETLRVGTSKMNDLLNKIVALKKATERDPGLLNHREVGELVREVTGL